MGAHVEFGILGTTELIHHGRIIPLGTAKQRGMIAVLLYHAGKPVPAGTIIEFLWDRPGNADHRPTLYSLASRLRSVLADVGLDKALVRVPGAYRLDIDPATVDLNRFRRLVAEAREATPEAAAETLVRALTLWRGDPLPELGGARAEQLRRTLADLLLDAHKLLAESQLACGRPHAVLDQLDGPMQANDLDETLARCWIRALRAAGRPDEAKRFATAFRRRYRREMRAEPDIDIVAAVDRPIADRVPRHLPPDIADFTGRRALLDDLDRLRGNNVIVVTGMPGVGKTTLATHWAHRQRRQYPDGQLHLDASGYGHATPVDPRDALDRFLRVLGVPPDQIPVSLEQRRDRFEDLIGDRRILLLIDNVRDSAQVRPLIPRSMNCLTVITSRTRLSELNIRDGVRTVTATPLPPEESVSMLARIIGPRAASEPDGLTELGRLSGGLPLAVRIIGERAAERPQASFAELTAELRHRRLLETAGDDDQEAGLTTAFGWSYHALRDEAAHLFRRISHHPGTSISPEAAAAIAGMPAEKAEGLLNGLAKTHMINHGAARRYRFHNLLHEYAIERSAGDDPATARQEQRRMLDWYLLSAAAAVAVIAPEEQPMVDLPSAPDVTPMFFGTDRDAMRWCEIERDNLCAVSRWAQDNGFHRHGWQIPGVINEIFERYGCLSELVELHQQALVAARWDEHDEGQIGILNNLGTTYFAVHDYDRAVAALVQARNLAAATGNFGAEMQCSHNLASAYVKLGELSRAIEINEMVLDACRKLGSPTGESAVLNGLGTAHLRLGHYQRAAENYHQALAIRERIGSKRGVGQSHSGLGVLHLVTGRLRLALWHCEAALAIHTQTHDQAAECDTLITLADVQVGLEMPAEAVRNAERAVLLGELIADSSRQVAALTATGDALVAAGDPESAAERARTARRILDDLSGVHLPPLRERLLALERTVRIAPPEPRAG
jgi:DNA-binding SARP family transcriptional activator/tetratricopeptide (TPR) repeat protein